MSRRFSAWQKLMALAPLLLVAVYLPGGVMMRCRIDGLLRPPSCCPLLGEPRAPGPALNAGDCCDPEVAQTQRPVSEAVRASDDEQISIAAFAPSATPVAVAAPPRGDAGWASGPHGPARGAPPIILVKHAFLI